MKEIYKIKRIKRLKRDGEKKVSKNGYVFIRINSFMVLEHRYVWELYNGKIPKGYIVHHKNENKKDNRIKNLILCSEKKHRKKHILLNLKKKKTLKI